MARSYSKIAEASARAAFAAADATEKAVDENRTADAFRFYRKASAAAQRAAVAATRAFSESDARFRAAVEDAEGSRADVERAHRAILKIAR